MSTNVLKTMFNVVIEEDNHGCVADVEKDGLSKLTNYVHMRYQFVLDHTRKGDMPLEYIPSKQMVADVLTKKL